MESRALLPVETPGPHIIAYEGNPGEYIYGFCRIDADGTIHPEEGETFGSLPRKELSVLLPDGRILSHESFQTHFT